MASIPFMPFYVSDYRADTFNLTTEQHGAYLLLLFEYWQTGEPLPDDDESLALITKMPVDKFVDNKCIILKFFKKTKNGLINTRAKEELEKAISKILKSQAAGKISAKIRGQRRIDEMKNNKHFNSDSTDVGLELQLQPNYKEKELNIIINTSEKSVDNLPDINSVYFKKNQPVITKIEKHLHLLAFDEFFKIYPNKSNKINAMETFWNKNYTEGDFSQIIRSLRTQSNTYSFNKKIGLHQPIWVTAEEWLANDFWSIEFIVGEPISWGIKKLENQDA